MSINYHRDFHRDFSPRPSNHSTPPKKTADLRLVRGNAFAALQQLAELSWFRLHLTVDPGNFIIFKSRRQDPFWTHFGPMGSIGWKFHGIKNTPTARSHMFMLFHWFKIIIDHDHYFIQMISNVQHWDHWRSIFNGWFWWWFWWVHLSDPKKDVGISSIKSSPNHSSFVHVVHVLFISVSYIYHT